MGFKKAGAGLLFLSFLILSGALCQETTTQQPEQITIKPQIVAEVRRMDPAAEPLVPSTLVLGFRNAALSSGNTAAESANSAFVTLKPSCGSITPTTANLGVLAPGACSATTCVLSTPVESVFTIIPCEGAVRIDLQYSFTDSKDLFRYGFGSIAFSSGTPRLSVQPVQKTLPSAISTPIDLVVKNEGSGVARNVRVGVSGNLIRVQGEATRLINEIPSHSQVVVGYNVSVDRPSATGVSELQVGLSYEDIAGSKYSVSENVGISVEATREVLRILNTSGTNIEVGSTRTLSLLLKNVGPTTLFNLVSVMSLPSPLSVQGLNEVLVGDLGPGEEREVNYTISVRDDVQPSTVGGVVEFRFFDSRGIIQPAISKSLGVVVSGSPDLILAIRSFDPALRKVGLQVANRGSASAKFVTARLDGIESQPAISYLGTLNPDDYATVDFVIQSPTVGPINFWAVIDYKDSGNQDQAVKQKIEGFVTPPLSWVALFVIVAAAGYFVYRWAKK